MPRSPTECGHGVWALCYAAYRGYYAGGGTAGLRELAVQASWRAHDAAHRLGDPAVVGFAELARAGALSRMGASDYTADPGP